MYLGRWFRAAAAASKTQSTQVGCKTPSGILFVPLAMLQVALPFAGTDRQQLVLAECGCCCCSFWMQSVMCCSMRAQPAGKPQDAEVSPPRSCWLYISELFALQGVWARMSDAIDRTWQALDEDLHREEAESPFQLARSVSHSTLHCRHAHQQAPKFWTALTHGGHLPLGVDHSNNRWSEVHRCCC